MTNFISDLEVIINEANVNVPEKFEFNIRHISRIANKNIAAIPTLDVRQYNALKRNDVYTVGQIVDRWNDLVNMNYVGAVTVKGIKNALLSYYYDNLSDDEKMEFWKKAFS